MSHKIYIFSVSRLNSICSIIQFRSFCKQRYILNKLRLTSSFSHNIPIRLKSGKDDLSSIVIPVPVTPANNVDDISVGEELSEKINKGIYCIYFSLFSGWPKF